jgi:hypothetical protein
VRYGDVAKQHRKIFVAGDDDQPSGYRCPVADTDFLIHEMIDKFRFMSDSERLIAGGKKPVSGHPAAAGYHDVVAVHGFVHRGGEFPGDDARADGRRG